MKICTFPDCTGGDCSLEAYRACGECSLYPVQHNYHVGEWRMARSRAILARDLIGGTIRDALRVRVT